MCLDKAVLGQGGGVYTNKPKGGGFPMCAGPPIFDVTTSTTCLPFEPLRLPTGF